MTIISGRAFADKMYLELNSVAAQNREKIGKFALVSVGANENWQTYCQSIRRVVSAAGIEILDKVFPQMISEDMLAAEIDRLCMQNSGVSGVFIQHPLPKHINPRRIFNCVQPHLDIECQGPVRLSDVFSGTAVIYPATVSGITALIDDNKIELCGKHCVIVGSGNSIGKPLALLFISRGATVTLCNDKTQDLTLHTQRADILIAAAGVPKLIGESMVKAGASVFDCGTNMVGGELCGDVDFAAVKDKCAYITPVPGGVAAVTTAFLLRNFLTLCGACPPAFETK